MMVIDQQRMKVGTICWFLQQRLAMKSFIETTNLDKLVLEITIPAHGRNPKNEYQIELSFISWISCMLIEFVPRNF
jgi:hypothetical protein